MSIELARGRGARGPEHVLIDLHGDQGVGVAHLFADVLDGHAIGEQQAAEGVAQRVQCDRVSELRRGANRRPDPPGPVVRIDRLAVVLSDDEGGPVFKRQRRALVFSVTE